MPALDLIGFLPQVLPLFFIFILFFVLLSRLFLPTIGQIFAVRKQAASLSSGSSSTASTSLKTSVFASPATLEAKALECGPSLHSVLQTQFSAGLSGSANETSCSETSKNLQTLVSYKIK
jgi:hypothetical protein